MHEPADEPLDSLVTTNRMINVYGFLVVTMLLMYSVLHCLYSVGNKITKGGFRGGRTGRAPPLKFFQIKFFNIKLLLAYKMYSIVIENTIIIVHLKYFYIVYPPPHPTPFFPINQSICTSPNFQSICATPNFKSWIRPWLLLNITIPCYLGGTCTVLNYHVIVHFVRFNQ